MGLNIYEVSFYLDDGWQRGNFFAKVLAHSSEFARECVETKHKDDICKINAVVQLNVPDGTFIKIMK